MRRIKVDFSEDLHWKARGIPRSWDRQPVHHSRWSCSELHLPCRAVAGGTRRQYRERASALPQLEAPEIKREQQAWGVNNNVKCF